MPEFIPNKITTILDAAQERFAADDAMSGLDAIKDKIKTNIATIVAGEPSEPENSEPAASQPSTGPLLA